MSEDFLWVGCVDLGGVSMNCGCESTWTAQNSEEEIHMWVSGLIKIQASVTCRVTFLLASSALSDVESSSL